jgi:hypothetical protein
LLLTFAAALLLAGAVLTPAPALGTGLCRLLDAFPATGQTTCWDSLGGVIACAGTGHDGDIQAGATLRYKDLGNGTILDRNTLLIWEKKDDNDVDPLHDKDTTYTWDNAFAVHVAGLNAANFAGRDDWRLPNVKELRSIIDHEAFNPAVDPVFNTACSSGCTVLNCSCTATPDYWSSSTFAKVPTSAWDVSFTVGASDGEDKGDSRFVRAVRGGCR